jgi:hypothetical protein
MGWMRNDSSPSLKRPNAHPGRKPRAFIGPPSASDAQPFLRAVGRGSSLPHVWAGLLGTLQACHGHLKLYATETHWGFLLMPSWWQRDQYSALGPPWESHEESNQRAFLKSDVAPASHGCRRGNDDHF